MFNNMELPSTEQKIKQIQQIDDKTYISIQSSFKFKLFKTEIIMSLLLYNLT